MPSMGSMTHVRPELPGVGASIGLDRLIALMDEAGWLGKAGATAPVLVALFPGVDPVVPFGLAARLRAAGIGAEVFPEPIAVGKQMGYGSTRGHRLGLIIGPILAALFVTVWEIYGRVFADVLPVRTDGRGAPDDPA